MVAVEAMALGRRRLWAGHLEAEEEVDATQPLITDFFLPLAQATLMAQPSPADEAGEVTLLWATSGLCWMTLCLWWILHHIGQAWDLITRS